MGLQANQAIVCMLLSLEEYHIIAFNETQCVEFPSNISEIARRHGYNSITVHAKKTADRDHASGGSVMFVKKQLQLNDVMAKRTNFGELIECMVNGTVRFKLIYRNPATNDFSLLAPVFNDCLNTNLKTFYIGDLNM